MSERLPNTEVDKKATAEVDFLNTKLAELDINPEEQARAVASWSCLAKHVPIPKSGWDIHARSENGPINAFATGVAKSLAFSEPMLEVHATVCPSYFKPTDYEQGPTPPIYTTINEHKQAALVQFFTNLHEAGALHFVSHWSFHTPQPSDRQLAPTLITTLGDKLHQIQPDGTDWLAIHADTTAKVVSAVATQSGWGEKLQLLPDMQFVEPHISRLEALSATDPEVAAAAAKVDKFHFKNGHQGMPRFCLYAGSVLAYGNPLGVLSLNSPEPVKVFIPFESTAGRYVGKGMKVDFRGLIPEHSLPLLIPGNHINIPWCWE